MRGVVWLLWVVAVAACGPTAAEIRTAKEASYAASPDEVYAIAEQVTASDYTIGEKLPAEHVFATVPVWFSDGGRQSRAAEAAQKQAGNMQVSFAVLVTAEGNGAKIVINASAIDYEPGKPDAPTTLDEAKLPGWVTDRMNKLRVAIHKRVQATLAAKQAPAK